jgi:5'-3' exonuclease
MRAKLRQGGCCLKNVFTEKQKAVPSTGKGGERKAKEWLEDHGFEIEEWFSHAHAGHYDIKASKGKKRWIIEVKTGDNPSINIPNFLKMLEEKGFDRIGLALVANDDVHLLEIRKQKIAALKAWKTRRKRDV